MTCKCVNKNTCYHQLGRGTLNAPIQVLKDAKNISRTLPKQLSGPENKEIASEIQQELLDLPQTKETDKLSFKEKLIAFGEGLTQGLKCSIKSFFKTK